MLRTRISALLLHHLAVVTPFFPVLVLMVTPQPVLSLCGLGLTSDASLDIHLDPQLRHALKLTPLVTHKMARYCPTLCHHMYCITSCTCDYPRSHIYSVLLYVLSLWRSRPIYTGALVLLD